MSYSTDFTFLTLLNLNVIDELRDKVEAYIYMRSRMSQYGLTVNVTFSPVRLVSVVDYTYAKYYVLLQMLPPSKNPKP